MAATKVTNTLVPGNRLYAAMQIDDHDNPAVVVRASDHRLLYFYSPHSGAAMYLSVSTNPEDISSFAARVDLATSLGKVTGFTYPNPVQLSGEANKLYLFYRDPPDGSTTTMRYSTSTDGGATWAAHTTLYEIAGRSSYWKVSDNGTNRIDIAVSDGHPMYDANVSIYHFYVSGGNCYKTDGTLIGVLGASVLSTSDMTLVYSGASITSWVWDVVYDGTRPYVAFTTYPSTTDHRANWARWTGSAWSTHQVAALGTYIPTAVAGGGSVIEDYYSGGIVLLHSDPTQCLVAIGSGSDRWDIWHEATADNGSSWTPTQLTTSGKNVRPVSVRNADPAFQALYMAGPTGDYASYTSYNLGTGAVGV